MVSTSPIFTAWLALSFFSRLTRTRPETASFCAASGSWRGAQTRATCRCAGGPRRSSRLNRRLAVSFLALRAAAFSAASAAKGESGSSGFSRRSGRGGGRGLGGGGGVPAIGPFAAGRAGASPLGGAGRRASPRARRFRRFGRGLASSGRAFCGCVALWLHAADRGARSGRAPDFDERGFGRWRRGSRPRARLPARPPRQRRLSQGGGRDYGADAADRPAATLSFEAIGDDRPARSTVSVAVFGCGLRRLRRGGRRGRLDRRRQPAARRGAGASASGGTGRRSKR